MDNSDLLEEWDVVEVYEAERANTGGDTKSDADVVKNDKDRSVDNDANKKTDSGKAEHEATTEPESQTSESKSNVVAYLDSEFERSMKAKHESNIEPHGESSIAAEPENVAFEPENVAFEPENVASEPENVASEPVNVASEPVNVASEPVYVASEPVNVASEPVNVASEPVNIAAEPKDSAAEPKDNSAESKDSAAEPEDSATSTKSFSVVTNEILSSVEALPQNVVITDIREGTEKEAEISSGVYAEEKANIDIDHAIDAAKQNKDDNIGEDIVHVDNPANYNLDSFSSGMIFDTESWAHLDHHILQEMLPDRHKIEQEMAAIESSSSDIDIIDVETIEESITSSFISPLSLSISSSVADISSVHSLTSQSEDKFSHSSKPGERIEDVESKKETKRNESIEKTEVKYNVRPEGVSREDKGENVHCRKKESQRTTNRRSFFDWFALLIELLRNMSGYDWCLIGGVAMSLYLTVVINQTNIFAVVQKENVMSQMKDMIDELKNDNKVLKEQMMSELKNDKVISSFERQIRELRKENSKLSHMLYDVGKVLDKQKYSHEKKEAEYLVPFKNEINKLKEYINILKFDNEELQKQLVRMRYGSFAQGGTDANEHKDPSKNKGTGGQKDTSSDEFPLDYESLKKWNELISLLTEQLGSLSLSESLKDVNSQSDTKNENSKPFWKSLFSDFKGTLNDLRKTNFTTVFSNYKKANERAVSDIYKFVKDFFTVAEHTQQRTTSNEDDSQWNNIGDFVKDLKEKWTNIKDRLYTSDLKKFFEKNFKKATSEYSKGESHSQKSKDAAFEHTESRTTGTPFKSEEKHTKEQTAEETKWMFNRAAHREELRHTDEEEDVNWFLKKGKENSEKEKRRF